MSPQLRRLPAAICDGGAVVRKMTPAVASTQTGDTHPAQTEQTKMEPPFPVRPMTAIAMCLLFHSYALCSLFPYVGYMVRFLGATEDKDEVGELCARSLMIDRAIPGYRNRCWWWCWRRLRCCCCVGGDVGGGVAVFIVIIAVLTQHYGFSYPTSVTRTILYIDSSDDSDGGERGFIQGEKTERKILNRHSLVY